MQNPESELPEKEPSEPELDRLFETYLPKLVRLADGRISERFKSKFDSDDIAATVCRSVFRRFREGKFVFDDDAEFWRLLVTIAKRKISNKVRHYSTVRRSVAQEISEVASVLLEAPEPSAEDVVAFEESLRILNEQLDDERRQVLLLRMEGREYHEIADIMGISERTVRRKMTLIKSCMNDLFVTEVPET